MNDLKNTFDKVKLDESKAAEIRDKLIRKKGVNRAWLVPVVAVMTALIIVLTITFLQSVDRERNVGI